MSLLYECINGIIQGGILGEADDDPDREEIASLCVTKLRGMIMVDGDPNRKPLCTFLKLMPALTLLSSQIRCFARVQQDCHNASLPGGPARGCDHGVHRQPRHYYPHSSVKFG